MPASASLVCLATVTLSIAVALAPGVAGAEAPAAAVAVRQPPRDPVTLEVGLRLGGSYRLGDAPAFSVTGRGAPLLGVGLAVAPSTRFSIGLAYEHAGIGTEHGEGDLGVVDVGRSTDALWGTVRITLFHNDWISLGITLGPGLVWQSVVADVIAYGGAAFQPDVYRCNETGGPGLGLRGAVGVEVRPGGGFFFALDALLDELRLGDSPLGTCAPGAGSTALLGARGSFGYRFDVSRFVR
jgi:hypothetical protein